LSNLAFDGSCEGGVPRTKMSVPQTLNRRSLNGVANHVFNRKDAVVLLAEEREEPAVGHVELVDVLAVVLLHPGVAEGTFPACGDAVAETKISLAFVVKLAEVPVRSFETVAFAHRSRL